MTVQPTIEVIVPTRGRPTKAAYMAESFASTKKYATTNLTLVLDESDVKVPEYVQMSGGKPWSVGTFGSGSMIARTNRAVEDLRAEIFGWAADDNVFITEGWDEAVINAFRSDPTLTTVNTNDRLVGDTKGGVFFLSKRAVRRLGWLLPPMLEHLYADYAVTELAKAAGTYRYLPDVVIEHHHPYAGKAQWDDGYRAVNTPAQDSRDGQAFYAWRNSARWKEDVGVLRSCEF